MLALRVLLIVAAAAVAVCVGGYLLSGDRRWLSRALKSLALSAAAALIFFAVLIAERLAA
jgi:hypothetical protein